MLRPSSSPARRAERFSDQYSLGVIAYELLAGVRPIQGDGFLVLVDQHLNATPVPLERTAARTCRLAPSLP